MQKIPTIFVRDFTNGGKITTEWHPDCLAIRDGKGVATVKWDGTSVMIRDGQYFKRYDAKPGKTPPVGFEPCGERDEKTGHHPGWVPVDPADQTNKWHMDALVRQDPSVYSDGTYELCGPKVQGNPHHFGTHMLIRHGDAPLPGFPRTFDEMERYFTRYNASQHPIEGVVFWVDGKPVAKIKAADFGVHWK
jgi:hypothetical protein